MRVNLEESVFEHLPRLAREMKWDEDKALGRLVRVYRATQRERVEAETPERLVTLCAIHFHDDDEAELFFTAMLSARLAVLLDDGRIRIRGNQRRIDEISGWYKQKTDAGRRGGIESQRRRKSSMVSEATSSEHQANTERNQPVLCLTSLSEDKNNTGIQDPLVPQAEASAPKPRRGRSPEEQARAKRVRDAFFAGHTNFYGSPPDKWGAPENAHVYHLLKSSSADVLAEKASRYFAWAKAEVLTAGHPFMNHSWSFSHRLDELKADIIAPQRRHIAAQAKALERISDEHAAEDAQTHRIVHEVEPDAYATGRINRKRMESLGTFGTGAPGELLPPPRAASQQETLGRQPVLVRETTVTVGQGGEALPDDPDAHGRESHAHHQAHQGSAGRASGAITGAHGPGTDTRGGKAQ